MVNVGTAPRIVQKLEEIIRLAKQDPIALMRAEKVPWIKLNKSRNAVTAGVIPADPAGPPFALFHGRRTDDCAVCRMLGPGAVNKKA